MRWKRNVLAALAALSTVASGLATAAVPGIAPPAAAQTVGTAPPAEVVRFFATSDLHFSSAGSNQLVGDAGTAFGTPYSYYSDLGANGQTTKKTLLDDGWANADSCVVFADGQAPEGHDDHDRCRNVTNTAVLNEMISEMKKANAAAPDSVRGLVIAGDVTKNNANSEWNLYHTLLEDGGARADTYDGVGNHDVGCAGDDKEDLRKKSSLMAGCAGNHYMAEIGARNRNASGEHRCGDYVRLDDRPATAAQCPAYSWDFGGVHFVNLMTGRPVWRDEDSYDKNHHIWTFLQRDLATNASDGRPVVLVQHYGLDPFSTNTDPAGDIWWTEADRLVLWNILSRYNVILMVSGHTHMATAETPAWTWNRPAGTDLGPESIPNIVVGKGCNGVEGCDGGKVPDDDGPGFWADVTLTSTGNRGRIEVKRHATTPTEPWQIKWSNRQRTNDLEVRYNHTQGTSTESDRIAFYDAWYSWRSSNALFYAVRRPTRVAVDSSTVTTAQAIADDQANIGPFTVRLTDDHGNPVAIDASTKVFIEGAPPSVSLSATEKGPALPTEGGLPYVVVPGWASTTQIWYGDTVAFAPDSHFPRARINAATILAKEYSDPFGALVAPAPGRLRIQTPDARVVKGDFTCTPVDVSAVDEFGNRARLATSVGLSFSSSGDANSSWNTEACKRLDGSSDSGVRLSPTVADSYSGPDPRRYWFGTNTEAATIELRVQPQGGQRWTKTLPVVDLANHAVTVPQHPINGPIQASDDLLGPFEVALVDGIGNIHQAPSDQRFYLRTSPPIAPGLVDFFATGDGTTPIDHVSIPAGGSTATFWARLRQAGSYQMLVEPQAGPGLQQYDRAELPVTVEAAAPANLQLTDHWVDSTGTPQPRPAALSGIPVGLRLLDRFGNTAMPSSNVTVGLDPNNWDGYFTASGATGADVLNYISFPPGAQADRIVHYHDAVAGPKTLRATVRTLGSTLELPITVKPAKPVGVQVTSSPTEIDRGTGATEGPWTLQLVDAFGNRITERQCPGSDHCPNRITVTSDGTPLFRTSPDGAATEWLEYTFAEPVQQFWYSNSTSGPREITLASRIYKSALQYTDDLQLLAIEVRPGPATGSTVAAPPIQTYASPTATAGPYRLILRDSSGTPTTSAVATTFDVTSASDITVATSEAGAPVTSLTVPAGSQSVYFWVGGPAGQHEITFTAAGLAPGAFTVALAKAPQTVSLSVPATGTYGARVTPTASATSGLPVTLSADGCRLEGSAVVLDQVGTCQLTGNQAGDAYFDRAEPVIGSTEVGPAPLTVTASSPRSTYGGTPPTVTASYAGLVDGDTVDDLEAAPSCSTTVVETTPVGTYPTTCAGGEDSRYTFEYVDGTARVDPALLTVAADDQSRPYGEPNATFTYSVRGFVNSEDATVISGVPSIETTATPSSEPGRYPIVMSPGSLSAANYTFALEDGILTITRAPVTLTASDTTVSKSSRTPDVEFRGTAMAASGTPISGLTISFSTATELGERRCEGITASDGVATCKVSVSDRVFASRDRSYTASFAGDTRYLPASDEARVTAR